jgi:hypothetical protein
MRDGHPAKNRGGITSEVLTPRRRDAALFQDRVGAPERKGIARAGASADPSGNPCVKSVRLLAVLSIEAHEALTLP